jgi:Protein of unknown function (DUF4238)
MSNIDSHIQPKKFLRGFIAKKENEKHNDFLFVYKKGLPFKINGTRIENNPAKIGLENVSIVTNFLAFQENDGTINAEKYERKREHEIESKANTVLDKLRSIQILLNQSLKIDSLLSLEERRFFAKYIANLSITTKKSREIHNDLIQQTADSNEFESVISDERLKFPEINNVLEKVPEIDDSLTVSVRNIIKKDLITDETFPESLLLDTDWLEPIISNMKWQIAITPVNHKLFTGDCPVASENLSDLSGWLVFPISTNIVFFAFNNPKTPEIVFTMQDKNFVSNVYNTISSRCEELYFSEQSEWLVDFFNSTPKLC